MSTFLDYLYPGISLDDRVRVRCDEYRITLGRRFEIMGFLAPLKIKDPATYDHCLRVGLLASRLGQFMHLDGKALLYAGMLHDVGKAQTRLATLQKTSGWTLADTVEIKAHAFDGYRMLRDYFDFTAEIVIWHHRFQPDKYPVEMPSILHDYSEGTRVMIPLYGRILSLADVFDALHRVNDKHGAKPLTGGAIKEKMLAYNRDQRVLIEEAYGADIFTTEIFEVTPVAAG